MNLATILRILLPRSPKPNVSSTILTTVSIASITPHFLSEAGFLDIASVFLEGQTVNGIFLLGIYGFLLKRPIIFVTSNTCISCALEWSIALQRCCMKLVNSTQTDNVLHIPSQAKNQQVVNIFQQGGTHGAQMSGAFEPFECLWMHIWAWHFCCISKTLPGLHGTIFCRSDLSSSGPPQRQGAAHLDHEQRSRISRKQDIRMYNCASCNGNHIGSDLPKVLFKVLFWALLLVKALFSHFFGHF